MTKKKEDEVVEPVDWDFLEEKRQPKQTKSGKPGMKEMIRAKCFDCMSDYIDGRVDCENTVCSLYRSSPYRKLEPDYSWRTEGGQNAEVRRQDKFAMDLQRYKSRKAVEEKKEKVVSKAKGKKKKTKKTTA